MFPFKKGMKQSIKLGNVEISYKVDSYYLRAGNSLLREGWHKIVWKPLHKRYTNMAFKTLDQTHPCVRKRWHEGCELIFEKTRVSSVFWNHMRVAIFDRFAWCTQSDTAVSLIIVMKTGDEVVDSNGEGLKSHGLHEVIGGNLDCTKSGNITVADWNVFSTWAVWSCILYLMNLLYKPEVWGRR